MERSVTAGGEMEAKRRKALADENREKRREPNKNQPSIEVEPSMQVPDEVETNEAVRNGASRNAGQRNEVGTKSGSCHRKSFRKSTVMSPETLMSCVHRGDFRFDGVAVKMARVFLFFAVSRKAG